MTARAPFVFFGFAVGTLAMAALGQMFHPDNVWDDAVVVRICPSGDMIYRLADGRLAVPRGGIVENLEAVCEEKLP
jgi:hypothetical protein